MSGSPAKAIATRLKKPNTDFRGTAEILSCMRLERLDEPVDFPLEYQKGHTIRVETMSQH